MDVGCPMGFEAVSFKGVTDHLQNLNKAKASLESLSKNIISVLLSFMELKTIVSFSMTNKRNKKIVESLNGIFFREITRILFTSEPDIYWYIHSFLKFYFEESSLYLN